MRSIVLPTLLLANRAATAQGYILDGFDSPEARFRPKFRYWLPDASADIEYVKQDLQAIAEAGAGGFEWLPYYQLGGAPTNWSDVGYGTEAFLNLNQAAMSSASDLGILMDFAVGASQGQGVPANPETNGLAVHLAYANVSLSAGETFNGTLPLSSQPQSTELSYSQYPCLEFGQQNLSYVLAVEVISGKRVRTFVPLITLAEQDGNVQIGQVLDILSQVDNESRSLEWTAPTSTNGTPWRIMAWYQRFTNQRSVAGGSNPRNYIQNGSWIVDHFTAAGSNLMTNFYDDVIVPTQEEKDLLAQVGNYAWEDSMEMQSALFWTDSLPDMFKEDRGYDIGLCLPYLIVQSNFWASSVLPYDESFTAATDVDSADKCIDDYRLTLERGYHEYLNANTLWAHSRGLNYSAQPAYNLPLDMSNATRLIDAPEGESLGFKDRPDNYLHISGPAHISGTAVVSSEAGAVASSGYSQTLTDLLGIVRRGFAGGISMNVLHGYSYTGQFASTSWPGFAVFSYIYTEMWSYRQPAWRHINETLTYIARTQMVMQAGTPQVDLAFYEYAPIFSNKESSISADLRLVGFNLDYIGPGNVEQDDVSVSAGILVPGGPAYKALIFNNQTKITVSAAQKINKFATAGLPIIFLGNSDFTSIGQKSGDAEQVSEAMSDVVSGRFTNVAIVNTVKELITTLPALDVRPRISLAAASTNVSEWYSFWRKGEDTDVAWLYNNGANKTTIDIEFHDIEFQNTNGSYPFVLDAWTGTIEPVVQYTTNGSSLCIPITLGQNQTTMIAFVRPEVLKSRSSLFPLPPTDTVVETSGNVVGLSTTSHCNGTSVTAYLSNGTSTITLSSGKMVNDEFVAPPMTELATWNLTIEDWHGSDNLSDVETVIDYYNYTDIGLAYWKDLDSELLSNVSGIGQYETSFDTPTTAGLQLGALLHLGEVTDSIRVWINGVQTSPVHLIGGNNTIDITALLSESSNTVRIETASTLYNRLRAEKDSLVTMGVTPAFANDAYYVSHLPQSYGLPGGVIIEWIKVIDLI